MHQARFWLDAFAGPSREPALSEVEGDPLFTMFAAAETRAQQVLRFATASLP
jgi:hypothetical protein